MGKTVFVAGTDTGVGKTLVTAGILAGLRDLGKSTAAIKPLAAGAEMTAAGPRNEDGLMLQEWQTSGLSYQQVNPVLLERPLSPHIAAALEQRRVTVSQLVGYCRGIMLQRVDTVLIEGAGGWRVPVNSTETLAGLPRQLEIPVILVVGMRLGCLNHALLTAEAILGDGVELLAWVANQVEPRMGEVDANLATLKARLPGRFLGFVPWLEQAGPLAVASHLDVSVLCSG